MTGKSKIQSRQFDDCFNRLIAQYFRAVPDKGFMKAKKTEYYDSLAKFPVEILDEAISEARDTNEFMPSAATLHRICERLLQPQTPNAAEQQEALEKDGEKSKTEFILAWEKLERFNRWELGQIREDAEQKLKAEDLFPNLGKSQMPCPNILVRQKMIQIAKERGVI